MTSAKATGRAADRDNFEWKNFVKNTNRHMTVEGLTKRIDILRRNGVEGAPLEALQELREELLRKERFATMRPDPFPNPVPRTFHGPTPHDILKAVTRNTEALDRLARDMETFHERIGAGNDR